LARTPVNRRSFVLPLVLAETGENKRLPGTAQRLVALLAFQTRNAWWKRRAG
jgi:hypothetical protein